GAARSAGGAGLGLLALASGGGFGVVLPLEIPERGGHPLAVAVDGHADAGRSVYGQEVGGGLGGVPGGFQVLDGEEHVRVAVAGGVDECVFLAAAGEDVLEVGGWARFDEATEPADLLGVRVEGQALGCASH